MITPESHPQEILLSLTKEELVSWMLHRSPFFAFKNARDAYWHALGLRFDKADRRIGELLEQVSHTPDHEKKRELFEEINRLHKKTDAVLRAMDVWGQHGGR